MEQRRRTKKIVDWIVAKATWGHFKGDKRDGEAPPITIQNFVLESPRYGARALRARLSRLSSAELLAEAHAVRAYLKARPSELAQIAETVEREKAARNFANGNRNLAAGPACSRLSLPLHVIIETSG